MTLTNTEYRRRALGRKLRERNQPHKLCQRRHGGTGKCLGKLEDFVDRFGRVHYLHCERCERFKAGICRDCARKVDGRVRWARYCAHHRRMALVEARRAYRQRWLSLVRKRGLDYNKRHREQRAAYARRWRAKCRAS